MENMDVLNHQQNRLYTEYTAQIETSFQFQFKQYTNSVTDKLYVIAESFKKLHKLY